VVPQSSADGPVLPAQFRWSAAVHEAGHAIVAWGLGLSVGGLKIFEADGAGIASIADNTHLGTVDRIAICAAGMEAVALLDVGTHWQAGLSDQAKIIELLASRPEAEHDGIRHEGHQRARTMLEGQRDQLLAVAEALGSAGHLDAEAFAALMRVGR
jgi:hypothetical protein